MVQSDLNLELFDYLIFDKNLSGESYRINFTFEMFCHSLLCKGMHVRQKVKYRTGQTNETIELDLPPLKPCGEVSCAVDLIDQINRLDLKEYMNKEVYFRTIKGYYSSIDSLSIKFNTQKRPIKV